MPPKERPTAGAEDRICFPDARIESRAPEGGQPDTRTATLSFSSEEAVVPRWFGGERLDHAPGAVRMKFLASGRAPLLFSHDQRGRSVGIVTSAEIGSDRRGHAVVRFSSSAEADSLLRDVRDGILTNVSVGYRVHKVVLESSGDDGDVYRVTDWEPLEISLVNVPADPSVGIGRSPELETLITRAKESATERTHPMPPKEPTSTPETPAPTPASPATPAAPAPATETRTTPAPTVVPSGDTAEALRQERARVKEIRELGARHNMGKLAEEHIDKGTSIELFRGHVLNGLDERGSSKPLSGLPADLGLSPKERRQYSLCRAVLMQLNKLEKKLDATGFERECSDEIAKRVGTDPKGLFIPYDIFFSRNVDSEDGDMSFFKKGGIQQRTLTSSGGVATGGALVQSTVLASQYVPPNYNVPIVVAAGARVLSGLQGNILIPAMTAGKSGTWINPENTAVSSADPTFAQIPLSPKDVGTAVDVSRRLLLQSNPTVDGLLRDDIAIAIANTIDAGAINGSGASGQPTGILIAAGTAVIALGTNGGPLTWSSITYLPQSVGAANRLLAGAPLGFVTNWQALGHALRTVKVASYPVFLAEYAENTPVAQGPGAGRILGMPVHTSQNVPSNLVKGASGAICSALIFGNWSDLLIGEWGVLDALVDPYTFSNTGAIRIRAFQTVDVNERYGAAFALIKDIITT